MNVYAVSSDLTNSISHASDALDCMSDTSTKVSNLTLNVMAFIGLTNLSLLRILIKNKGRDIISRGEALLSSFALGTINSLYYILSNSQGAESTSAENSEVTNYFAPAQISLLTISLVFHSLGRDSFNLIPTVCMPISYLMGVGSSLYAVVDALAYNIGMK